MARIFPDRIPERIRIDPKRSAEREMYEVLVEQIPARFSVFAWVSWLLKDSADRAFDGEADFVIADPDHGLLVLEVKGGGIERDGSTGQWFSIDRVGNRHVIQDPFEQARRNRFSLIRKLETQSAWRQRGAPSTWHAIAFPSVEDIPRDLAADAPRDVVITRTDLGWMERKIRRIFDYWEGDRGARNAPGAEGLRSLEAFLAPTRRLKVPLKVTVQEDMERLEELSEEQFDVLDGLGRSRRVLIHGGPGTGKTVLALEKATRLARDEGFKTLLTCFNQPLARRLAASAAGIDNLVVRSFHKLCREMAVATGLQVIHDESSTLPNSYFRTTLPEHFVEALGRTNERFDAIVVDEGQDFSALDRTALELALVDRDHSVLYVFQDESQSVYLDGGAWPNDGSFVPYTLPRNLRNTAAIHEVVCNVSGCRATRSSGVVGSKPEFVPAPDLDGQREALRKILHRLIVEEHLSASSIVILGTTRRVIEKLAPQGQVGPFKLTGDHDDRDPRHVLIESITRFKGLERDVAILVGLETVEYCDFDALLCVGASRARAHLVIIGSEEVLAKFRAPA